MHTKSCAALPFLRRSLRRFLAAMVLLAALTAALPLPVPLAALLAGVLTLLFSAAVFRRAFPAMEACSKGHDEQQYTSDILYKQAELDARKLAGEIRLEEENCRLVDLQTKNEKKKSVKYDEVDLEQISLFDTVKDEDVVRELEEIDITTLTPVDALNVLYRLQNKLKNRWQV